MTRRLLPWLVLSGAALLYPLVVSADRSPRFPSRSECVHPARVDGNIDAVFGRFQRRNAADRELRHVLGLGFKGSEVEFDDCGVLKVVVHGVPTLRVGADLVAEACSVGLHLTLEQATSGG